MRVFTTMLNQFCLVLVWLYFTHHFLTPKEKGWKRELLTLPVWLLYISLTATLLWEEAAIKAFLFFAVILAIFYYIYEFEWKHFLLAILLIYSNGLIGEILLSLIIIAVIQKPLIEINAIDNLILLPIIVIFSFLMFDWILKRSNAVAKIPTFILALMLSQIPIATLIEMNNQQNYTDSMLLSLVFIILIECLLLYFIWNKKQDYFHLKKQQIINKQLQAVYQEELDAYLLQRDQEEMYRRLRHDLLNEVMIVSLMEQKTNEK